MSDARHDALPENRSGVLLLSTSFLAVTRLRLAIARDCALACHCASSVARAREVLAGHRIVALVLEPEDARGEPTASLARESRSADASRPIVAIVRRAAGWSPTALALLAVQPDLVVLAEELDAHAVLGAIAPPLRVADLLADVWPRLEGDVPAALRPVVHLALARAAAPLPVTEFALALGLHRKTLWMQCRRHGVASVQALMMWCRLIAVTHALRTRPQSVEWIANEMDFPSPTALRNATRRYLGVTPTELRAVGGEELACSGFRRWLRGSPGRGVTTGDAA
jgi:AraC-like DNA-binding protein